MKKLIKAVHVLLTVSLVAVFLTACSVETADALDSEEKNDSSGVDSASSDTDSTADSASSDGDREAAGPVAPFTPAGIPEASGTIIEENELAVIDYSNTGDGYVMVDYTEDTANLLKVQVAGPSTTYTYDLERGAWTTFPLSDGDGTYKVTVYESMGNDKYSTVLSASFQVALSSEFAPFLHANQYVDYSNATNTMAKTAELVSGTTDTNERVGKIYDYVIKNVSYDTQKAANIESGYLPVLDDVLASRKGICFDYASLMAGMLRSCEIPCKLVVGYSGDAYHAWVSVFDGSSWQRMDPTFASANNESDAVLEYIGDGDNYTPKFEY